MPNEIRKTPCMCGMVLWDRHTEYETAPGHYLVCIYCGQILQLNDDLRGEPIELSAVHDPDFRAQLAGMQLAAKLGRRMRDQLDRLDQSRRHKN